jgi:hypothetical protein
VQIRIIQACTKMLRGILTGSRPIEKITSNRTPNGRTWGQLTSPTLTRPVRSKFKSKSYRPWANARSAKPLAWHHLSPLLVLLLPPQIPGEAEAVEVGAIRVVDHVFFVCNVTVLAAGTSLKHMMPISIQSNFPHIALQFGADLNCPNCPSICCAVDSCAALTTGNFHFFASIAKSIPHCVAKVFAPQDYAPIILSGIVQFHQEAIMTKLEVGFQFHLSYKTKEGDESSLMIATGPNVSDNIILGLPFMLGMGMILNLVGNLAECKHLDCHPFPIYY